MSLEAPATLGELIERRKSVEDSRQSRLRFTGETIERETTPSISATRAGSETVRTNPYPGPSNWAANLRATVRKLLGL